ncbi:MAG: HlyD family type I secretion periplasmic adaptor subunit [Hyphomicrobium sp.]|jgi:HlyD family secretion protein|nr:HlyD family type I secretion periplasmic adaptor subunit [Hyphomicrobium sp.]
MTDLLIRLRARISAWLGQRAGLLGGPQLQPADTVADMFGSPVAEIEDEEPNRWLVRTGSVAAAMLLAVLGVSAIIEIDVVASGTGEIVMAGSPETLQAMERSIVRSIHAKPGDAVRKGDVIVTLDPTFARADLNAVSQRQHYLASLSNRLSAEASALEFEPRDGGEYDVLQARIFKERQGAFQAKLRWFDEDIASLHKAAASQRTNLDYLAQQRAIAGEVEAMREGLYRAKVGSRLMLLDAQNLRLKTEKEIAEATARANQLHHAAAAREAERQTYIEEWRRDILEELARVKEELTRVSEEVGKSQRRNALVELRATNDGVISETAAVSEGSIVREAEALVTIMPTNRKLMAEAYLKAQHVGLTRIGDEVTIKVDALPYQRFGTLKGRLNWISETTYSPQVGAEKTALQTPNRARLGGEALHRIRIDLDAFSPAQAPAPIKVAPGMTIVADVKLKTRSVLGLLFDPLRRGLNESLREP